MLEPGTRVRVQASSGIIARIVKREDAFGIRHTIYYVKMNSGEMFPFYRHEILVEISDNNHYVSKHERT